MIANKTLSRNAIANFNQAMITGLISFVLYRFINDTLGVALLGVWSVVLATASSSRFADLGMGASVTRFVALYLARNQPVQAARMIETAILSLLLLLIFLLPVIYLLLSHILNLIFSDVYLEAARNLLPFAFVSLGLTMISSIVQSGFDGCQRMDLRANINIVGQLLMLLFCCMLIPYYGLNGLAFAQILQGLFVLVVGWVMLRNNLKELYFLPNNFSTLLFREMFSYGANIQISGLFILIFDPLTKILMARFGGVASAGYFEMANQVVLKMRALIVTANQAIVPRIAQIFETEPSELKILYVKNINLLLFISLPIFSVVYVWGFVFSWLLLGEINEEFIFLMQLVTLAWVVNIMAAPAYFTNQGIGDVVSNTKSHAIMGLLNIILGSVLGSMYGMHGVAVAYFFALVIGSIFLIVNFQAKNKIINKELVSAEHRILIYLSATVILLDVLFKFVFRNELFHLSFAVCILILFAIISWINPSRKEMWNKLSRSGGEK